MFLLRGGGLKEAKGNKQLGACAQILRLLCTQSVTRAHGHNQSVNKLQERAAGECAAAI